MRDENVGTYAIYVKGLRKQYGSRAAVDGVSFAVERGEVFGIVGPNGAGKTTTVECVEGQRAPDAGMVRIGGMDPIRSWRKVRGRIGVQLQEGNLPGRMRVGEALRLFAAFYGTHVDRGGLQREIGLPDMRASYSELSGGQRQRLFVALAVLHEPEVLFLDELTSGLDPEARRQMWTLVEGQRRAGRTVCLTTHSMEEAERLCDRVAVFSDGRVAALDTPRNLLHVSGCEERVAIRAEDVPDSEVLERLEGVVGVEQLGPEVVVTGRQGIGRRVGAVTGASVRIQPGSLDDAYLRLVGFGQRRRDLR